MTSRERWARVLQCQSVDQIPDLEFGCWPETLEVWREHGLPDYITDGAKANVYFGISTWGYTPFKVGIEPDFQYQVVQEDERHKTIIDFDGVLKRVMTDGSSTLPKYIKFPIESRADWNGFKKRLDPESPERIPSGAAWSKWLEDYHASMEPVNLFVGSLFGWIRNWMGFENVSYAIMDDPGLIEEIMEHLTELTLSVLKQIPNDVRFEVAHMWEDMCFNAGPILPPRYFEKWMSPRLKRITDYLTERRCHSVWVDCDGRVDQLVPLWLDAGVSGFFPIEARSGSDIVQLREQYGTRIRFVGGVDKTTLIAGKGAIDRELARLKPVAEGGGYIPTVDHWVPPDVSLANFVYYLHAKREAFGIPEPDPWALRKSSYTWADDSLIPTK